MDLKIRKLLRATSKKTKKARELHPLKNIDDLKEVIPDRVKILAMRLRKWFLFSVVIGLFTGSIVALLDYSIHSASGLLAPILNMPIGAFLLPVVGLTLAGISISFFTKKGDLHGTEEVLQAYHKKGGVLKLVPAIGKIVGSFFTIALGGSAGLEGPSIYIGGVVSNVVHKVAKFFKLKPSDIKAMLLAGAAAGIAAIFKAPLTGIVFGLEFLYKDDLAKEAFIPSLVASTTSYITFVSIMGVKPLFYTQRIYNISYPDLIVAGLLGIIIGLAARTFIVALRRTEDLFEKLPLNMIAKMAIGGAFCGLAGLISVLWFGEPLALGIGYEHISRVISEVLSIEVLVGLVLLKSFATIATLAPGGLGGIFIPMILIGGSLGAIIGKFVPFDRGHMYPVIGMASFLAAGYKTPLAAVIFVAETTGSPGFIIPGLIAAGISFTVSGRLSVSRNQRWSRMTKIETLLKTNVEDIMIKKVIAAPANITISAFVNKYLMKYRHKSLPVIEDKKLIGMITLNDINDVPMSQWANIRLREIVVAKEDVRVAYTNQSLSDVLNVMNADDVDRLPVVSRKEKSKLVGIISSQDIVRSEELSKYWTVSEN